MQDDDITDFNNEWTRYQIMLPEDDEYDPDDALDARIASAKQKERNHVIRGRGIRGI